MSIKLTSPVVLGKMHSVYVHVCVYGMCACELNMKV